jgi:hypothetical protein
VSQQSTNQSFDELARALAEGSISRRRALKLFAGTALAALIPSRALADDDCVKICHIPFDDGRCRRRRAETRCLSPERAELHLKNHRCDCVGSCASTDKCRDTTSTTTSTTSTTPMCIPDGGTCSTGGTPCCSGNCNSNGFCCESGRVGLSNGTCAKTCTSDLDCPGCSSGCDNTTAEVLYCLNRPTMPFPPGCQNDADCALGQACARTTLTSGECWPVCPPPTHQSRVEVCTCLNGMSSAPGCTVDPCGINPTALCEETCAGRGGVATEVCTPNDPTCPVLP